MFKLELSIITVNYNNNKGLKKTLESIKNQSFQNYEHIIIDAGSNDGSKDTILKYAEKRTHLSYWVSEKDNGIYDGMNKGILQAKGEYIYFLNSGDCLMKDILKKIKFDGTKYIFGDMRLIEPQGFRDRIAPNHPDLTFFFYDSLSHQACFIHNTLFKNKKYDCNYKIVADWAHSLEHIVFQGVSYKHLPLFIAECDGTGVSSNYYDVQTERIKWFQDSLSPTLYESLINLLEYDKSELKEIIPQLNKTRKFQKRIVTLISFLLKINLLFSNRKRSKDEIPSTILYKGKVY